MQKLLNWLAAKTWRLWFPRAGAMCDVRVFRDGDAWCALSGLNLQEGCCGFGATPRDALEAYRDANHFHLVEQQMSKLFCKEPITNKVFCKEPKS